MLTIEDAKTKWCPMARVVEVSDDELSGPFNRYHSGGGVTTIDGEQARCLADGCMMWRTATRIDRADDKGLYDKPEFKTINLGGYCGLAGRRE